MHRINLHFSVLPLLWLALPLAASAQKFYTYIGDVGPTHALIAWGTTTGENTIGRTSRPHGKALIRIDGKEISVSDKNWIVVQGLRPDTEYPYEVSLNGKAIAKSQLRTWPEKSE